ncbi:MAG: hypothetical protein ABI720_04105 [Actinomycetes bacterium]
MTETYRPGSQAIDGYMGRVDAAARDLPPDRRIELLDQLREHLDAAANAPGATEAAVLGAIDRLGDPTEIVASEREAPGPTAGPVAARRSRWGPLEIIAVVLLIVGPFVAPVVGPLAGLVCAWLSPAWTRGEKWVATLLASGSIVLVALFFLAAFI